MKIVFASSWLSHHQLPFCESLIKETNNSFTFIASRQMPKERLGLGYEDMNTKYDFVLRTYDNEENMKKAQCLVNECDVLIAGGTNLNIKDRILNNKITFLYSERLYKNNGLNPFKLKEYLGMVKRGIRYKNKKFYLLSAGNYAAHDYGLSGLFKNKSFEFGYFPQNIKYDLNTLISSKKTNSLLWAGRLISWKHPDLAIKACKKLKEDGYNFNLDIIGNGEMEQELQDLIKEYNLEDNIHMLGAMPPTEVRKHMEESEIYLFTSDRGEGWGVVLNEAMNSGCVAIANTAAGSTNYLIQDKENGLIFNGAVNSLYEKIKYCFDNSKKIELIQKNAYKTIDEIWNAQMAAKRLVALTNSIEQYNKLDLYDNGPCCLTK